MNIYSSVPEKNNPKIKIPRSRILYYLQGQPDKFVTARQICADLNIPVSNTQCALRNMITQLLEIDHQPIISNGKGYCYTKNQERLSAYHDQLCCRLEGLIRRVEALNQIKGELIPI